MGSARKNTKSSASSADRESAARFVLCIRNRDYAASLELRKVYRLLKDERAAKLGHVRVIDESGEDYLYPEEFFVPIKLPQAVERAVLKAV
ncbi:MAG TPA: hypothetical protein VN946_03675 [Terriglobales bacterium]|jgi:hypothetical protein|nr:hypothetical protein [Terriglobales bacterium]